LEAVVDFESYVGKNKKLPMTFHLHKIGEKVPTFLSGIYRSGSSERRWRNNHLSFHFKSSFLSKILKEH
jgi:hypothetical protein